MDTENMIDARLRLIQKHVMRLIYDVNHNKPRDKHADGGTEHSRGKQINAHP